MSHGSRVLVTDALLDARALADQLRSPQCGALLTFEGTVRDLSDAGSVTAIDYEAWPEMAIEVLERIRLEIEGRHPGTRLALAHRHGRLELGETSVVVACAAPHRAEAFAACRLAMDRIKEVLPIWKNEILADGRASSR